MVLKLYVSQTSGNVLMKLQQDHIRRTLDCKQIGYEEIDVADPRHKQDKLFMQKTLQLNDDDFKALPPQIFLDGKHKGDYESFFKAVECEKLFSYLDMTPPPHEVECQRMRELTTTTIAHFPVDSNDCHKA